jgi:PPOX class probable FMN-dependent enzyme
MHRLTEHVISSEDALRAIIGHPTAIVCAKRAMRLNALTRQFIERAPLACVATVGADGSCDVSPRGDPAGFVRVIDDVTLLMPERPGNRLADSLVNILATGRIGLLFLIPGVGDTFRVNGRATITDDAALLEGSTLEGKVPKLGIIIDVEEAYTQCSKALIRSDAWNPAKFIAREALPTNGSIHKELAGGDFDAEKYDRERAERYARREGFY